MIDFTDPDSLTVAPLRAVEKAWIRRLQKVLEECPERLELLTSGDAGISVVDADGARGSDLADGAACADGIVLADISGGPTIHGVSA